jgi:uracil-DNA glycosylase
MEVQIKGSWKNLLSDEFEKEYFKNLMDFVKSEYQTQTIYPPGNKIFSAFDFCSVDNLKVVILGQDPYHGKGQANGLCFSVSDGEKKPPSLQNIFKEIKSDLDIEIPESGNLERWAKQGILLINATLTVRASDAGSHQKKGWETFTDSVIKKISSEKQDIVFLLWGAFAQKKEQLIDTTKHHILKSPHPSPFSAHKGFLGNKHFSKTNDFLNRKGKDLISW